MNAAAQVIGRDRSEGGFSLIEVVIAIGVLAGVLLSICSMFILGGRQLKTGKTVTEATAICHAIMESFDSLSFTALYTTFGAAATDTTMTVSSTTIGSAIQPFQTEIARKLSNGVATVTVIPRGPGTPNFGTAIGIRMTVTITWTELARPQSVSLSTVRF
jgi:type II secretory pathway pseudopilin PulG